MVRQPAHNANDVATAPGPVPGVHTKMVRRPVGAVGSTVTAMSSSVSDTTVTASMVTPGGSPGNPSTAAIVPGRKLLPVTVSAADVPAATVFGVIELMFGIDTARTYTSKP